MRKIAAVVMLLIMLLAFSACDGSANDAYRSSTATDISNAELEQLIQEAKADMGQQLIPET